MNQDDQGDSSGTPSVLPVKRRRGRPRKDPSLKHTEASHVPPGFVRMKEYLHQKADQTNDFDIMVGQPVTGVVEATFDAGYLLSVRISNSDTKLRGFVFKPGHHIRITAANDVAPHVKMIKRNDVHLPTDNQQRGQKLAIQAGNIFPSKCKDSSSKFTPCAHPDGVRGNVVPVVLRRANFSNGTPSSYQTPSNAPQTANLMELGDTDVHMVEPLTMLLPDRPIPISQIFMVSQPHPGLQVSLGREQNNSCSVNEGVPHGGLGDKGKPTKSTDTYTSGSSHPSDSSMENDTESLKAFAEDSGVVSMQGLGNTAESFSIEFLQSPSATKPLFNYGTGRMTELLKAVQENMKENDVREIRSDETVSKIEASVP